MTSNLPLVAVLHGEGSASPLTIKAASIGICRLLFLHEDCSGKERAQLNLLSGHAAAADRSRLSDGEVIALLRREGAAGLVTFSELQLPAATRFGEALGLIVHSAATLSALTDKHRQRTLLSRAGVQSVRHAAVDRRNAEAAAGQVGFPAVLKPRTGAGSKWTGKVTSLKELQEALEAGPSGCEYVLEEYLAGDPALQGRFYGDYVSVESLHRGGESRQVCVTAKLPLTEHFAETGMFVPHPFSRELERRILDLEAEAIRALGVADGVTHTEIKLTAEGPKIIEVNGRLGGYVPEIVKRAMGADLVRAALQLSLGQPAELEPEAPEEIVYQLFLAAPPGESFLFGGMAGIEEAENMDGVLHLEITKETGQTIDYRLGTQSNMGIVYGAAPDYESFSSDIRALKSKLAPKAIATGGRTTDAG